MVTRSRRSRWWVTVDPWLGRVDRGEQPATLLDSHQAATIPRHPADGGQTKGRGAASEALPGPSARCASRAAGARITPRELGSALRAEEARQARAGGESARREPPAPVGDEGCEESHHQREHRAKRLPA